jgi:hypothetical protein
VDWRDFRAWLAMARAHCMVELLFTGTFTYYKWLKSLVAMFIRSFESKKRRTSDTMEALSRLKGKNLAGQFVSTRDGLLQHTS